MIVCSQRDGNATLFMFKKLNDRTGSFAKRLLDFRHPNLVQAQHFIDGAGGPYVGYEYTRYTLEEVLNVHMQMDEVHLRAIAQAVRSKSIDITQYQS